MQLPKVYLKYKTYINSLLNLELDVSVYNTWATELLKENDLVLPENAYVFHMHQGYTFDFFLLQEGDDPPVYYYLEGESIEQIFPSFSEYINSAILYYTNNESK
jgi:hypothetical protein